MPKIEPNPGVPQTEPQPSHHKDPNPQHEVSSHTKPILNVPQTKPTVPSQTQLSPDNSHPVPSV